jgi:hypothetical protein
MIIMKTPIGIFTDVAAVTEVDVNEGRATMLILLRGDGTRIKPMGSVQHSNGSRADRQVSCALIQRIIWHAFDADGTVWIDVRHETGGKYDAEWKLSVEQRKGGFYG